MAIVWAVSRLRSYLINIKFKIVTDCQAFLYLKTQKKKNLQIIRWANLLSELDFVIVHRELANSCVPVESPECHFEMEERTRGIFAIITLEDEIVAYQFVDENLNEKCEILKEPEKDRGKHKLNAVRDYVLLNDILYNISEKIESCCMLVRQDFVKVELLSSTIFKATLELNATCLSKLRQFYFFPGMRRYVKQNLKSFLKCLLTKAKTGRQAGLLHPIPPGKCPFAVIYLDHEGPFVVTIKKIIHMFL